MKKIIILIIISIFSIFLLCGFTRSGNKMITAKGSNIILTLPILTYSSNLYNKVNISVPGNIYIENNSKNNNIIIKREIITRNNRNDFKDMYNLLPTTNIKTISINSKRSIIAPVSENIYILIPKTVAVDNLNSYSGNISISNINLNVENLNISSSGGDVYINYLSSMGNILINSAGGEVFMTNVNGAKLININSANGELKLNSITNSVELRVDTGGGDLYLKNYSGKKLHINTAGGNNTLSQVSNTNKISIDTGGGTAKLQNFTKNDSILVSLDGANCKSTNVFAKKIVLDTDGGNLMVNYTKKANFNINGFASGGAIRFLNDMGINNNLKISQYNSTILGTVGNNNTKNSMKISTGGGGIYLNFK